MILKVKVFQNSKKSYAKIDMLVLLVSGLDVIKFEGICLLWNLTTIQILGFDYDPIEAVSSCQFNIFWAWFAYQLVSGFVKFEQGRITAGFGYGCFFASERKK